MYRMGWKEIRVPPNPPLSATLWYFELMGETVHVRHNGQQESHRRSGSKDGMQLWSKVGRAVYELTR
jgi:hypothetical protein